MACFRAPGCPEQLCRNSLIRLAMGRVRKRLASTFQRDQHSVLPSQHAFQGRPQGNCWAASLAPLECADPPSTSALVKNGATRGPCPVLQGGVNAGSSLSTARFAAQVVAQASFICLFYCTKLHKKLEQLQRGKQMGTAKQKSNDKPKGSRLVIM